MRITLKDLESKIDYLNWLTVSPLKKYLPGPNGGQVEQIGNYHLHSANGGHQLLRFVKGGGSSEPLNTGLTTKKNLWYAIDNYKRGIVAANTKTEAQL